ncbi:MAG: phytanoyl-CoA dioxygenase family protein [Pseudomonadota bacterium]
MSAAADTIGNGAQGPSASAHAAGLAEYQRAGAERALALGNRGPLKLDGAGRLDAAIHEAFLEHGFYVFEQVIDADEIAALQADALNMIERAPVRPGAEVDAAGRPALGLDYQRCPYRLARPLSDPWGGTNLLGGRHPHQMTQPRAADSAPEYVVFVMYAMCEAMPSGLRLYGHHDLLSVAQSINGTDFVPFNDAIFVKQPGLGASVSWHQDGVTHWQSPNWDPGIHGFNFQVQLFGASLGNCLWVVPGTHKLGRIDIKAMIAEHGGSDMLPTAVPLQCAPGDVTIVNRQLLHGSFANSSADLRVSLTFGFHRRTSVLGARAALAVESDEIYGEERVFRRSTVIPVAIDARAQQFPDEQRFQYAPFAGREHEFRFDAGNFDRYIHDYNVHDLAI